MSREGATSKKYKKIAFEDAGESMRKVDSRIKQKDRHNKITNYFSTSNSLPHQPNNHQQAPNHHHKIIAELEEKVRQKDQSIEELKSQRQGTQERVNTIKFNSKQCRHQASTILAANMLTIADKKREERRRYMEGVGYSKDMKSIEGTRVNKMRMQIEEKEKLVGSLVDKLKPRRSVDRQQDRMRIQGSLEFHQKELCELRKELQFAQKQLTVCKDMLKLWVKEQSCYYCKKGWPVIYERYQTLELLGKGGFGEVYKCYDLQENRMVAIKRAVLPNDRDQFERQDFIKRMQRQVNLQGQLSHPNIAKLHRAIQMDSDNSLMVFELQYCTGPELGTYLRKMKCIQESRTKNIMKQLFSALTYLSKQTQRIIHYDLKPGNIMFDCGVVKIVDFGLSKIMMGDETRIDLTAQGIGTMYYLPPQTFDEEMPQISSKVDVWSLGVIFFQLLYGAKPFGQGLAQDRIYNQKVILHTAYKVEFPKETPCKHHVSQQAKTFMLACLAYNQNDRLTPEQAYRHPYFSK